MADCQALSDLAKVILFPPISLEGLSCLLMSVGPVHLSRGGTCGYSCPLDFASSFTHDCFVFSEASRRGTDRLQEILNIYSRGSGQLANKDKSAMFFSTNCEDAIKVEVRSVL